MRPPVVAVSVDNGGTWVRLVGVNRSGRRVWSLKKPSPTLEHLPAFLRRHLKPFRGSLARLAVGSRGVWKVSRRRTLQHALQGLAGQITVMSDVEAAWLAAFAPPHPPLSPRERARPLRPLGEGIIVIAGTGSIAYGRTADGRCARAGGFGPEKGDEGSGYWIGREWLKRIPSPMGRGQGEGRQSIRMIASLAPIVIRRAQTGNSLAMKIIDDAQAHLAKLVMEISKTLRMTKVRLSVSGGLFMNPWFKRRFRQRCGRGNDGVRSCNIASISSRK